MAHHADGQSEAVRAIERKELRAEMGRSVRNVAEGTARPEERALVQLVRQLCAEGKLPTYPRSHPSTQRSSGSVMAATTGTGLLRDVPKYSKQQREQNSSAPMQGGLGPTQGVSSAFNRGPNPDRAELGFGRRARQYARDYAPNRTSSFTFDGYAARPHSPRTRRPASVNTCTSHQVRRHHPLSAGGHVLMVD